MPTPARRPAAAPALTRIAIAIAAALVLVITAGLVLPGCSPPPERAAAVRALARWEDRRLADNDSLAAMLAARDAHVRLAAMRAAGLIGREEALPGLIAGLADRSLSVRQAAATALGDVGSRQGAAPLARAAGGKDRELRIAALEALAHVPGDGLVFFPAAARGSLREAVAAWDGLRERAADCPADSLRRIITAGLDRDEPQVQWRVLRCAERARPDSALVRRIAPFARARHVQVRVHALRALAQQGGRETLAAVLAGGETIGVLPAHDAARVQIALARALGRVGHGLLLADGPGEVDPDFGRLTTLLVTASRQSDPHVVRTACEAMAVLVDRVQLPPEAAQRESLLPVWRIRLARAAYGRIHDSAPAVRAAAVRAWGELRGAAAAPELEPLVRDPDPQVAAAAAAALGRCGPASALRSLRQACDRDRPPAVREAALPAVLDLWTRLARSLPDGGGAELDAGARETMARAARDGDFGVAATAVELLGQMPSLDHFGVLCQQYGRPRSEGQAEVRLGVLSALEAAGRSGDLVVPGGPAVAAGGGGLRRGLGLVPPDSLRARLAAVLRAALDDADRRVRLQGRAAALATGLLPPVEIPSEASLLATLPAATRSPAQPPLALPFDAPRLRCVTARGEFVIALDGRHAPNTAAALAALAQQGFYHDMRFHRVVPDFVIQGGDPRGDGWGGPPFSLRSEPSRVAFERGTVGIADSGRDTGGSQFFVCLSPQPHLNGRYTVAGKVVRGLDVVDAIQQGDTFRVEVVP